MSPMLLLRPALSVLVRTTHDLWTSLNHKILNFLDSLTLDDLVKKQIVNEQPIEFKKKNDPAAAKLGVL